MGVKLHVTFLLGFSLFGFLVQCNIAQTNDSIVMLSAFSWSDCGGSAAAAKLESFSLKPDPLILPGNVIISAKGSSKVDAVSPLKASLSIKRKVAFWWVKVPCVDGVGSCDYSDFCQVLENFFPVSDPCPPVFTKHNIPCHCPIPKGEYEIPSDTVPIPKDPLPSFLTDGDYQIQLSIENSGSIFTCLHMFLSLDSVSNNIVVQMNE